jgi:16S rRNA (guanine966-N2)-methyltransferase
MDCQDRTTILHTDARAPLKHSTVFDIVFLDPPFHTDLLNLTLQWLLDSDSLHPNTLIYLETPKNVSVENFPLSIRKETSASDVTCRLVSPC